MLDDLIAFLNARLDEDEAAAKAWLPLARLDGSGSWYDEVGESNLGPYSIEHARLHDPARVLRDVEARQRIVRWYEVAAAMPEPIAGFTRGVDTGYLQATLDAIRALAAVYSDHPDYRPEWAP